LPRQGRRFFYEAFSRGAQYLVTVAKDADLAFFRVFTLPPAGGLSFLCRKILLACLNPIFVQRSLLAVTRQKPPAGGTKPNYPFHYTGLSDLNQQGAKRRAMAIPRSSFDGYRVQMHVVNETIQIFTPSGNDWTNPSRNRGRRWQLTRSRRSSMAKVIVPLPMVFGFLVLHECAQIEQARAAHRLLYLRTICASAAVQRKPLFAR